MIRKLLYILSITFCFSIQGITQDIHFSQYSQLSSYLNPALSSISNSQQRFSTIYRNQWSSLTSNVPFRSIGLSADLNYRFFGTDHLALNIQLLNDKVGLANFSQTSGMLGLAYSKKLSQYGRNKSNGHFLSFGMQGGFGQNSVDWSGLWFGNQFDLNSQTINTNQSTSGESFLLTNTGRTGYYLDLNAGLVWYMRLASGNSFFAGVVGHHLNSPNISLLNESPAMVNSNSIVQRKYTVHLGANYKLNRSVEMLPRVASYLQGRLLHFNLGSSFVYHSAYEPDFKPRIGAFLRMVKGDSGVNGDNARLSVLLDAFIINVGAEYGKYDVSLSYDFTVSQLTNFNRSRGAFELSFTYSNPFYEDRDRITQPRF